MMGERGPQATLPTAWPRGAPPKGAWGQPRHLSTPVHAPLSSYTGAPGRSLRARPRPPKLGEGADSPTALPAASFAGEQLCITFR